jgi:carboxymethylenebutenolidase
MKKFIAILAVASLAFAASAQDWAKARLDKSPRHIEWIKVKNDKREVNSFIAYPEVKDKATAVVVIHEIFGLTDWVRGMADQFAEAGYIAIAPDLLSGMGPNGGGTDALGRDKVGQAIRDLPADQITADLNAIVEYVSKLPACNGKVVVAGFCWGLQRQGGCRGVLLGWRTNVPLRDEQQKHQSGFLFLRSDAGQGRRHRQD